MRIYRYKAPQLIIILCFFLSGFKVYAQVERAKVLGSYVYNFANLTGSEKIKRLPTYNIVLVSNEPEIKREFEQMEEKVMIGAKKIHLTISPNASNIDVQNTCLIFIGKDRSTYYKKIYEATKHHEILLVSENYEEKRNILLNLYDTDDGKVQFEINKGNIYERDISISEEVLLLGGTEIDVVQLYLDTQEKLHDTEQSLSKTQKKLYEVTQQVNDAKNDVLKQRTELEKRKSESDKLMKDIVFYRKQLKNQELDFIKSKKNLISLNNSLSQSKEKLQRFKNELVQGAEILKQQNKEITKKEKILEQKNSIIRKQRTTVFLVVGGFVVVLLLSVLLLNSYLDKKKKNKLLYEQRNEITLKNKKLKENNQKINEINEELCEKNEELTITLEEIKFIQNQLVQAEKMASLGVLSAGIAHEINNPINFVYAGINSLLRDFQDIEPVINEVCKINPDSDDIKERLKTIEQLKQDNYFDEAIEAIPVIINDIKIGADRTAEIVKGLKSFSRMDKTELQVFNIHEGLDTALLLLKNKYKNNIEIIKKYGDNIPVVKCYPGKIDQAFLNILSNAIDSIKKTGTIWVSTSKRQSEIHISIKDNGCGMPQDVKEKIFDPFFTTKDVGKGTGLGLSITYGIIREHNGDIMVRSEIDKGSEFLIKLPIT